MWIKQFHVITECAHCTMQMWTCHSLCVHFIDMVCVYIVYIGRSVFGTYFAVCACVDVYMLVSACVHSLWPMFFAHIAGVSACNARTFCNTVVCQNLIRCQDIVSTESPIHWRSTSECLLCDGVSTESPIHWFSTSECLLCNSVATESPTHWFSTSECLLCDSVATESPIRWFSTSECLLCNSLAIESPIHWFSTFKCLLYDSVSTESPIHWLSTSECLIFLALFASWSWWRGGGVKDSCSMTMCSADLSSWLLFCIDEGGGVLVTGMLAWVLLCNGGCFHLPNWHHEHVTWITEAAVRMCFCMSLCTLYLPAHQASCVSLVIHVTSVKCC